MGVPSLKTVAGGPFGGLFFSVGSRRICKHTKGFAKFDEKLPGPSARAKGEERFCNC